jgi:hypothetical protein
VWGLVGRKRVWCAAQGGNIVEKHSCWSREERKIRRRRGQRISERQSAAAG